MNRLDKKQIFIGTILGIILSTLTLILLTRNIQPLSAQQTQPRYMIFKTTAREGFKFMNMNDTRTYVGMQFIGGRPYLATLNATSMLWITVNSSTPGAGFIVLTNRLNPNQQSWIGFTTSSFGFFMNNPQLGTTTYAPIFAQTPTTTSPGNQVVTKEYLHSITDVILNTIAKSPEDAAYSGSLSLNYYTYVRDPSRDQGGHVGNRLPCDTSWRDKNCPNSYSVVTDLGEYAYDWDGGCSFFGGCWRYSYAYRRTNTQSTVGEFFRFDLLGFPYAMLVRHTGGAGYSSPIPMEFFNNFCADSAGCDVYIYQLNPFWGEFGKCIKRENNIHCDWGDRAGVAVDGDGRWQSLRGGNCDLTDAKVVNWNGDDNATGLYLYQTGGSGDCRIFIKDY